MNEYETKIAFGLEAQFGSRWYLHGAHPQTVRDYLEGKDEGQRLSAVNTMKRDAIFYASNCLSMGLAMGLVAIDRDAGHGVRMG